MKKDSIQNGSLVETPATQAPPSIPEENMNSPAKTVFSVANTMVGSSIIVIPLTFAESGILTSVLVLTFVGIVSFKTCDLLIIQFKRKENDISDTVHRILGKRWYMLFIGCSIFLMILVDIIYFILMANVFYPLVTGVLTKWFDFTNFPDKSAIVFDHFSFQWAGIVLITLCFLTFSVKDSSIFIKLNSYGIYAVISFIGFVIVLGIRTIITKTLTLDKSQADNINVFYLNLFTSEVTTLCGVFALAFLLHNFMSPILKNNREFRNTSRDFALGYLVTGLIYVSVGIFGYLGIICGPDDICKEPESGNTFLDYFNPLDYMILIVEFVLFAQLFTVLPILLYISRSQILNAWFGTPEPEGPWITILNVVISISCIGLQMFNLSPKLAISLSGAICGFFLIYIIPIKIHMKMVYNPGKDEENNKSLVTNNDESVVSVDEVMYSQKPVWEDTMTIFETKVEEERKFPKALRLAGFGLLIVYAIFVLVIQFISIYNSVFGKKDTEGASLFD